MSRHDTRRLRTLRKWLGLTQQDVAVKTGAPIHKVYSYERGSDSAPQKELDSWIDVQWEKFLTVIGKRGGYPFVHGLCYRIIPPRGGTNWRRTDFPYVFRYEGKQGIHHCFREIHGGWTQTFTDAQLIDKTIKEVDIS